MRGIQHYIDLIPISILPNKPAYRVGLKEHNELKRQVDNFLRNGFFEKVKVHVYPTLLVPKKDGSHRKCVSFQAINHLLIHDEVRFNIVQRVE